VISAVSFTVYLGSLTVDFRQRVLEILSLGIDLLDFISTETHNA